MAFPPRFQDQHRTPGTDGGAPCFGSQRIGQPITFVSGQFAGQTIRAELQELQKADSGRKYAKVDRRPLDPPPAILLRLFHVSNPGTDRQWEREVTNYEDIRNLGIICTVDLFPVPDRFMDKKISIPPSTTASNIPDFSRTRRTQTSASSSHKTSPGSAHASTSSNTQSSSFQLTSTGALKLNFAVPDNPSDDAFTYYPLHPFSTPTAETGGSTPRVSPFQIPRRQPMLGQVNEVEPPPDIVLRIGNHLVTESCKLTPALVGEKFVEPALIDYKGKKSLVFVFGDLAVQREGTFIFRYRAFDIFSTAPGCQGHPILAELYGGAFRVYSTREFPGLEPSTDLTRSLSKYGVRVTLRDAERKSKKRSEPDRD